MNVRDLEISLRPRRGWEATDLGFLLTREYYRDLFKIGLFGFFPVWIIIIALCWKWQGLAVGIIWLLKPIYDRFYLFYFSRRIFGQQISVKEVLRQAPRFVFKRSIGLITWRRLSPARSMLLPILDLEDLRGKQFRARCSVVKRVGGETSHMTTVALHLCEQLLYLGLIIIIGSLIPYNYLSLSFEDGYEFLQKINESWFVKLVLNLIPCIIYLCLEPFYVGAGFCLYLNSRSSQEAWDIELRFKEFATRLKKGLLNGGKITSLILLVVFSLGISHPLSAEQKPQEVVEEVFQHEDFKVHTQEFPRWEPDDWDLPKWLKDLLKNLKLGDGNANGAGAIDGVFKLMGIIALAVLVIAILAYIITRIAYKDVRLDKDKTLKKERPETVMGMAITRDSLPENLLDASRELWRRGEHKLALSYLYRAALSDIILEHDAEIESSDTEYECQRAASKVLSSEQNSYFHSLTKGWIAVAYSKFPISDQDFETLCQQWLFKTS